jgi:hypothetical protein
MTVVFLLIELLSLRLLLGNRSPGFDAALGLRRGPYRPLLSGERTRLRS